MKVRRSWLLVPLSDPYRVAAARQTCADVVVLDLVELVSEGFKPGARAIAADAIKQLAAEPRAVFVQIDATDLAADLEACVVPGLTGVMLSRVESPETVRDADQRLHRLEQSAGLSPGSIEIAVLLETATGNRHAHAIAAASPRVTTVSLGRADLVMDLRPEPSGEIHLMPYLNQRLIAIAHAVGVQPVGAWWRAPDRGLYSSADHARMAAVRGRAIGYRGSLCLLEEQAASLNEGYTPAPAEVSTAIHTRDANDASLDRGRVRQAQALIDWSKACAEQDRRLLAAAEESTTGLGASIALVHPTPTAQSDKRSQARATASTEQGKPPVLRSGLFMPIVTAKFVDTAWRRGCDYIILDLEDSVPAHLKDHARTLVRDAIPKAAQGGSRVHCRVNHDLMEADTSAAVWPGLHRIMYPKTESAAQVRELDALITRLESERDIPASSVKIGAHPETCLGVTHAFEIAAASTRIEDFAGGYGYDMSRDLGVEMFGAREQFMYSKGEVELAARAAGLEPNPPPLVADVTGNVSDPQQALKEAEAARQCGFRRGLALHPAVIEQLNRGFTPTPEEVADAHRVLERYPLLAGHPVNWEIHEGRIIDRYETERARQVIDWAKICLERDAEKAAMIAQTRARLDSGGGS